MQSKCFSQKPMYFTCVCVYKELRLDITFNQYLNNFYYYYFLLCVNSLV